MDCPHSYEMNTHLLSKSLLDQEAPMQSSDAGSVLLLEERDQGQGFRNKVCELQTGQVALLETAQLLN